MTSSNQSSPSSVDGQAQAAAWRGKVCLITGVTQGIGRVTAREIAKHGPTTILVARDAARGEEVVREVKDYSHNPDVSLLVADLSSQKSIRELAAQFKAQYDRLHLLVNNAGGMFMRREVTADGLEQTFALNHMGYFLLTRELLDLLKASAPARIVNVSSEAHRSGVLNFDDLQGEQRFRGFKVYSNSKLANVLHTYELARRLAGTGVTANCLHPGVVATGFGKNNGGIIKAVLRLGSVFLLTPEQGARTSIYVATSPDVEGVTGQYFKKCRSVKSSERSYDTAAAQRLWEISEQLLKGA